jgi:hypothetical protein
MRANIRYTAGTTCLIARGEGPVIQEGKGQYRELCEELISLDAFEGAKFSWGDEVIERCAGGTLPPGAQAMWRAAGTSHHLEVVTRQLKQEQA